jgi:hypothetical protein
MKNRTAWILGMLVMIVSASTARLPSPGQAANTGEDVTFAMPDGWVAQALQGQGPEIKAHYVYMYRGAPYGEMYLSYEALAGTATLDRIFEQGLAKVRPNMPYYQARGTQKTTVGGMPAIVHDFSYMPSAAGVIFIARTYTMIAGSNVYTFFFQTVQNYFAAAQPYFARVMATVKAAPKAAPAPATPDKAATTTETPKRNPAWATPKPKDEGGLPALVEDAPEPSLYPDPFGRYAIKLPEGAVLQKTEENASWFKMPAARTSFIIHNCRSEETVNSLAASFGAGRKANGAPSVMAVDGREATVSLFTAKDAAGENLAWVVAAYKGSGLLIVINLPVRDYAGAQAWIRNFLRGVKFNAARPAL